MKKKVIYYLLISIFLICFFLILFGVYSKNTALTYIGVGGLFGGGFLLAIICTVVMFMRAKKKADKMDQEKESGEHAEKEPYTRNRYAAAEDAFAVSIHGFRHLPSRYKLLGILFLTATLGSVFAGLILLYFRQTIAACVCFGIFGGSLLIGISAAILSSCGIRPRKKYKRQTVGEVKTATVLNCDPYSSSYSYSENSDGDHVTLYRVDLEADGIKYKTFDAHKYETGAKVAVHITDANAWILGDKTTERTKEEKPENGTV